MRYPSLLASSACLPSGSSELSKRKKKRGNKAEPDSYLNLVTAILNLVIAILLLIEKLTE